jgi:hypothetical protein
VLQLDLGAGIATIRLELNGPGGTSALPLSIVAAIDRLPVDAKLAYACQPFEEVSFGSPDLLVIDALTGHPVEPMCFEADVFGTWVGATPSAQAPAAGFSAAPQHLLFPDASAEPSPTAVTGFLKAHGIDYLYVDAAHPNSLLPDAVPIAQSGAYEVLRVP